MADFSSLKQTIQAYIKQNGNEEITGNILQDVLLAMVTTMGDSAINSLASALQDETTARQNQDGTLQGNISAEATARQQADTALGGRIDGLQTAINGINTKLAEGYIYAGIATPSTNPGTLTGKVFYIAVQAGTYTDFGNTIVKPGISILKYNGSAWSNEQVIYTDGGVFDVSAYNGGATYASLEALLSDANLSTIIPSAVRKGGMSIKFVQTFDNKYVQYMCKSSTWSSTPTDWEKVNNVSVSRNTITLPDWESNTAYWYGNQVEYNGLYYRCTTSHTSGDSFDSSKWAEIDDFVLGGSYMQVIGIGDESNRIYQNCIKLVGMGINSTTVGAVNENDVYYRTDSHLLRVNLGNNQFGTLPYLDGAIYTCNDALYRWNGSELVRFGEMSEININSLREESSAYTDKATVYGYIPNGLRKLGLNITYLYEYDVQNHKSKWITEQYIGADITNWTTLSNWQIIAPIIDINISRVVSDPAKLAVGQYGFAVGYNDFVIKLSAQYSFDRIKIEKNQMIHYNGQTAIFDGSKLTVSKDVYSLLHQKPINVLSFVNKQVSSSTGEPTLDNQARLSSEMFISQGLDITIADGFAMYLYMYDLDGNYLGCNESSITGHFVYKFPFACKLRLVFKHTDGTSAIITIKGVVDACVGIYDYDLEFMHKDSSGVFELMGNNAIILPVCNVMRADNVLNANSKVSGKIRNDSGAEVTDGTSCYFSELIPAYGGCYIRTNSYFQRIYYIGADGEWLGRSASVEIQSMQVPSTINGEPVHYIQFQFRDIYLDDDTYVRYSKTAIPSPTTFKDFAKNTNGILYENEMNVIWSDTFEIINYNIVINDDLIDNELLFEYSVWEPSEADSGYSNPETGSGRDTDRDDWTATDKYKYYEFLEHYYDGYLGQSDKYSVTKRKIFQSGQCDGHEVFEYDFCPINYKYVIMLSAGMNANETQGIWGLATFIKCLMNEEEAALKLMKENIRFKVIPIINAAGFDYDSPLKYGYVENRTDPTEVNPNFNFNFKDSWANNPATWSYKGEYPDSCIETLGLKKWINENSGKAIFWADLHTGRWIDMIPNKIILDWRFGSLSSYYSDLQNTIVPLVKSYYVAKGYISNSDYIGGCSDVRNNVDYQKQRYAVDICGIQSCMPEMHIESTGYGTDGETNNSPLGIKAYVLQIRLLVMYAVNTYIQEHQQESLPNDKVLRYRDKFGK